MELFFREFGNGYPLVILHGLYGSSDNWTGIARELSDTFRVIVPDMRNHGQSPHHPEHSYDEMSNDLLELTHKLGVDRFILAGHSMGGKAAVWFSKRWPERISGLIVVDISPFKAEIIGNPSYKFHREILRAMINAKPETLETRDEAWSIFDGIVESPRIRKFLLKNITRSGKGLFMWKLNPEYLESNLVNILDGLNKSTDTARPLTGFPVKFLKAENSDYISEEEIPLIYKVFPAAEIETVNGTSHWLHDEKPEVFIGSVREILGS